MWELPVLVQTSQDIKTEINGKWVPARPVNFTKQYTTGIQRLKWAWEVFRGRAEAFKWPDGQ
jgi:hypothetical protein